MLLNQLDVATVIVNYAFIIIIGALAVAFAISFGIGGRDFAKKTLERVSCPLVNGGGEEQGKEASASQNNEADSPDDGGNS